MKGPGEHGDGGPDLRTVAQLLPTPAVNDMGGGKSVTQWDEWTTEMRSKHGNGNGHGPSLEIEAQRIASKNLPTPTARDNRGGDQRGDDSCLHGALLPTPSGPNQRGSSGDLMLPPAVQESRWGIYETAIRRHEQLFGRPAPEPTIPGAKTGRTLSPWFVEWIMVLPEGWVCDVLDVTTSKGRNAALKGLGNGVVPIQAATALRILLNRFEVDDAR